MSLRAIVCVIVSISAISTACKETAPAVPDKISDKCAQAIDRATAVAMLELDRIKLRSDDPEKVAQTEARKLAIKQGMELDKPRAHQSCLNAYETNPDATQTTLACIIASNNARTMSKCDGAEFLRTDSTGMENAGPPPRRPSKP